MASTIVEITTDRMNTLFYVRASLNMETVHRTSSNVQMANVLMQLWHVIATMIVVINRMKSDAVSFLDNHN